MTYHMFTLILCSNFITGLCIVCFIPYNTHPSDDTDD